MAEHSVQSMFNRQVTDGDVIGKAVSNEPVKHSHRAIIRGLLLGLGPLTLRSALQEPLSRCDLSVEAFGLFCPSGLIIEMSHKDSCNIKNFFSQ